MDKPNRILVKFRINPNRAAELRAAGPLHEVKRTVAQDEALRAKQAAEASSIGRDPFRGQRIDASGAIRPDSGTPIFTWDPKGRVDVCLQSAIADIVTNLGMTMTQVNLLQKPDDHMAFLVIKFEQEGDTFPLNDKQRGIVERITGRVYGHLHGYRNPDKSWTLNAAHAEDNPVGARDVRVDAEGHFRCIPR